MGKVVDHLLSPQGRDPWGHESPQGEVPGGDEAQGGGEKRGGGSGWMGLGLVLGPGRPRWRGYGLYLGGFILGAILAFDIVRVGDDFGVVIGIVAMLGAAYGALEVYRGKPVWKR